MSDSTLTKEKRDALRARVDNSNLTTVARELGMGRNTLSAILAGIPVRAGSVALIEKRLAELDAEAQAARAGEVSS